jgi:hypothetical protein
MRHQKRSLQPPPAQDSKALKPQPPADLWDKLELIEREIRVRPEGSFTALEYADHLGISRWTASYTLGKMEVRGKVLKHKIAGKVFWSIV